MSSSYRIHYLCCSGRNFETSEEVLEIQSNNSRFESSFFEQAPPPKEFFIAIKQLMSSQCGDLCTSQYKRITLCPTYVRRYEREEIYMSYQKFSDNFLKRMESINVQSEVYDCEES